MKKMLLYLKGCFLLSLITISSCQKELSCQDCNAQENLPPIAVAGNDTLLILPTDSLVLNGANSFDTDGQIIVWNWRIISGPAVIIIQNPSVAVSAANNFIEGIFHFELSVTDDDGVTAKDTVRVTVDDTAINRPPIARAGNDISISLPTHTVSLDGSGSSDPDNNISGFLWSKIEGPSSFSFNNNSSVQTEVSNLLQGVYQFELKVTDVGGLYSTDTVQVTVQVAIPTCDGSRPVINMPLTPIATIPELRFASIAWGAGKILFGGGVPGAGFTKRVDIYDVSAQSWSLAELSEARHLMATIHAGDYIFFAGGEIGDGTWPVKTVDIYNTATNSWSVSQLSTAGHSITAATIGNKVLFVGGDGGFTGPNRNTRVDMYDISTHTWSMASLSEAKYGPTPAVLNGKIYFSGGSTYTGNIFHVSPKIEIYDNATNTWSLSSLSEPRAGHAGIAFGNKLYWAGGSGNYTSPSLTCSIEINDVEQGTVSTQLLSRPAFSTAIVKNSKILFFSTDAQGNLKVDIYDPVAMTWAVGEFSQLMGGHAVIFLNNVVYLAGGTVNGTPSNKIWKLEY